MGTEGHGMKTDRNEKKSSINYERIGERIKKRRKEMHLSQSELAEKVDLSNNHISSIETGKQGFSMETLALICDALEVSPDYLLLGNMHSYNIPEEIAETLKLCSEEDIEYFYDIVNLMVARNTKGNISEKYLKRLSVYRENI